jgi:DNA polymerase III beta subunit, central domain
MKTIELGTVSPGLLKGLLRVAANEDIRTYLNGINVEPTRMTATDGHMLLTTEITFDAQPEPFEPFIVPRALVETALRAKGRKPCIRLWLSIADDGARTVTVNRDGTALTAPVMTGTFPDYERCIPTKVSDEPAQFSAERFYALHCAMEDITGARCVTEVAHNGHGSAVVSCGTASLLGVLMPLRCSGGLAADALAAFHASRRAQSEPTEQQAA